MAQEYTEQEQVFVSTFLEESRKTGEYHKSFTKAKEAAGYPASASKAKIFKDVKELLLEGVSAELAQMIPKMLNGLEKVVDEPSLPGAKNIIAAAATLLDRAGVVKTEKSEVKMEVPNGVLILPSKTAVSEDTVEE